MNEINTRKAYREAQAKAAEEAKQRDQKRQAVEKNYAKTRREYPKFDETNELKIHSLKVRLNWAIGIVVGLIVVVALVLFLL